MDIPESFIVTIEYRSECIDIDISSGNTLEEIKPYIAEVLRVSSGVMIPTTGFDLYIGGSVLPEDKTPAELGLFDGRVIRVIPRI